MSDTKKGRTMVVEIILWVIASVAIVFALLGLASMCDFLAWLGKQ